MTQPTPAELREAALRLHDVVEFCSTKVKKDIALILSHFPADGQELITADWLREEWGFEQVNWSKRIVLENSTGAAMLGNGNGLWIYEDDDLTWPIDFTTRQQFRTLAGLLGIEPKRKGE